MGYGIPCTPCTAENPKTITHAARCRNMPAGATRPLRARHRRASPRVFENAQGCSATQPCAIKIQKHMALTAPCAPPPYTSVHIRTYPYGIAHSIGSAQCTLPTGGNVLCFPENAFSRPLRQMAFPTGFEPVLPG